MLRITLIACSLMILSACGGGGGSSNPEPPPPPPVVDTTPPEVTLIGDATINHEQGTEFVDPGATATDDTDGTLTVTVTGSVGTEAGTYTLTYTATDAAGNSTSITREVIVADTIAPSVTLNGAASINHEQGTVFTDPGANATDVVDGSVEVVVTGEVGTAAGSYTLTYTATDAAGNSASETRTVNVQDTTAPVITLNGEAFIQIDVGVPYEEPGATATDLVDGNVVVTITGTVNENVEEDYILTYSATDAANNTAELTRTVRVGEGNTSDDIIVLSQGVAGPEWDGGFNAFDTQAPSDCSNDGGAGCPSIGWSIVNDAERGEVLEIEHSSAGDFAIFFIISSNTIDLTEYRDGALIYDLKTVVGDGLYTTKLDCVYPCTSGDKNITDPIGETWTEVIVPLATLEASNLDLARVNTGLVVWARNHTGNVFRVDNARFVKSYTGESSIGNSGSGPNPVDYNLMAFGAGNVSDTINPASYRCDIIPEANNRSFLYNAGVRVSTELTGCLNEPRDPQGVPAEATPQVVGDAAAEPLQTHRWWGSVSYLGEMTNGDPNSAAYITPDPISARISNTGFRVIGLPAGIRTVNPREFAYPIPDPFAEVFDGIAVGNSVHNNLQGFTSKTSDGSITVEWQSGGVAVMNATFVHGSPYVYINVLDGDLELRTLREDGGEKGTYFLGSDSFGVWTNVAGQANYFLLTGDGATTFTNTTGNVIGVSNPTRSYTLTLMPTSSEPSSAMINFFEANARNVVDTVSIDYQIDPATQAVEVTRSYLNAAGVPVTTVAGMQPLHWKYATGTQTETGYEVRSARGITKFVNQSSFTYELPHVGVLPALPTFESELDVARLTGLIDDFLAVPTSQWIRNGGGVITPGSEDTYWSGKAYNRVAELIAISDALGLTTQKTALIDWLKAELEDWFTAETDGTLDENKYFVYDENWDTLFGMEEAFASHQQLNDHHFHYGYFVRAAAEICRHEPDWCSETNYGPMVELLIRDYAGGRDDPMFPYLRHFDPANGFSWASGSVNFIRGNNNESTSEAANSYGAMILYGLITGNEEIRQRGQYMHASTSAAYWEYWNNIGGYSSADPDDNNFPAGYSLIATSIIWGDGGVFSTFFSGAVSYILGIQGLPSNGLMMHIGIYSDYLVDYVELGVSEGNNMLPSGLIDIDGTIDQWPDIWWNILAMTNADASIADYESVTTYDAEIGESKAHTYHWINTFKVLGQIAMGGVGPGFISADYPTAMAFSNNGVTNYVVYNYGVTELTVTYSDGTIVNAAPQQFTVVSQ